MSLPPRLADLAHERSPTPAAISCMLAGRTHFFDRKAREWRTEQERLLGLIQEHQTANPGSVEDGIQLLELSRHAHVLFGKQEPSSKRRLLDCVLSNSTWKNDQLTATFRQPFDVIAVAETATEAQKAAGVRSSDLSVNWLPGLDSNHARGRWSITSRRGEKQGLA